MNFTVFLRLLVLLTAFSAFRAVAADTFGGPVGVAVTFKAYDLQWGNNGSLDLGIEGLNGYQGTTAYAYDIETDQFTARLEPGKTYSVEMSSGDLTAFVLQALPPPGYVMEIERVARERIVLSTGGIPSVQVRVIAPYQEYTGRAGTATPATSGRVLWQAAMGSLLNGSSAGALSIIDTGASDWDTLFSPAGLRYEHTSSEVTVIYNPWNVAAPNVPLALRQIIAPQACADIEVIGTNKASIKFYHRDQLLPGTGIRSFRGAPFAWYLINEDGAQPNKIIIDGHMRQITDLNDTNAPLVHEKRTVLERTGTAPNYIWHADEWYDKSASSVSRDTRARSGNNETIAKAVPGGATAISGSRTYASVPWGEEIVSESLGSYDTVTTNYEYYTTADQTGNYGRMRSRLKTGGHWEAYEYYDYVTNSAEVAGALHRRHRPFKDSDTSVPSNLGAHSGEVTTYTYEPDAFGRRTRPATVETKINGVTTAYSTTSYSTALSGFSGRPQLRIVTATRQDSVSGGSSLTTITKYFREDAGAMSGHQSDDFFRFQTHSIQHPDGRKQSFLYQRGSWNGSSFTASGNGGTDPGSASRIAVLHGATSGGTSYTSHWGYDIDDLQLVANKSTMQVTIRNANALIVRTENHVWTGSAWELVNTVSYDYNYMNQLVARSNYNTGSYAASYTGERLNWEKDDNGAKLTYTYDVADRVIEAAREGSLSTRYSYNAAGLVTQEIAGWGQSETLTTNRSFDDAGRLRSETPPGIGATTYGYNPGARTRTVTAPHSGTRTETLHADGRIKSVTGSAVVEEHYTHEIQGGGVRYTRVNLGHSTSSRIRESWTDWLGRVTKTSRPGWPGKPAFVEEFHFDGGTGRLMTMTKTGYAPTRYEYNVLGHLVRTGLDLGSNGLSTGSMDRITDYDQTFEKLGNDWWLRSETKTYPFANNGTAITTSVSRQRLSGFQAGQREEVQTIDAEGNTTNRLVSVEWFGNTVTVTTSRSGYPNQVETFSKDLLTQVAGHDGLTYNNEYDGLRRLWKQHDPRGKTTTTTYKSGSLLVHQVLDHLNQGPTYHYDAAGRQTIVTDAAGKNTRYAYNARSQVTHQWGDGAYPVHHDYDATFGDHTYTYTYRGAPAGDSGSWPAVGSADSTRFQYEEASGFLYRKYDAVNQHVEYGYDPRGQVELRDWARTYNGQRVRTTYIYDGETGELAWVNYNDGTPGLSYAYNRLGQLTGVGDATGSRTFAYDGTKPWRHYTTTLPAFYGGRVQTSLYENSGVAGRYQGFRLGSSAGSASELEQAYAYTGQGRFDTLASRRANNSVSRTFRYSYRTNSNLVETLSIDGGHAYSATRGYHNDLDLLASIDTRWSGTSVSRHDYTYTNRYQRETSRQSGTAFADYGDQTFHRYTYNARGEVIAAPAYLGSNVGDTSKPLPGRQHAFAYDSIGSRLWGDRTGVTAQREDYTVNGLNQYTAKENHTAPVQGTVDALATTVAVGSGAAQAARQGRFWSVELPVNNGAQAWQGSVTIYAAKPGQGSGGADLIRSESRSMRLPKANQSFTYDLDGNLTNDGVWVYSYDAENRLVKMQTDYAARTWGGVPHRIIEFVYDYLGRRVQKRVRNGDNSSEISSRRYLYDGWNLIAEYEAPNGNSIGSIVRSYTWGLDLMGSLSASGGVGALLQIHDHGLGKTLLTAYDGNGNLSALLNADTGTLEAAYEYSPFGEQTRAEGLYALENPFRFSTKFFDRETGLLYYGHRYYAPGLGRFINRDPIEEAGGFNLYGFVGNNPISHWDVLGMFRNGEVYHSGVGGPEGLMIYLENGPQGPGGYNLSEWALVNGDPDPSFWFWRNLKDLAIEIPYNIGLNDGGGNGGSQTAIPALTGPIDTFGPGSWFGPPTQVSIDPGPFKILPNDIVELPAVRVVVSRLTYIDYVKQPQYELYGEIGSLAGLSPIGEISRAYGASIIGDIEARNQALATSALSAGLMFVPVGRVGQTGARATLQAAESAVISNPGPRGFVLVGEGSLESATVVRRGEFANRVFDSRYGSTPGVSGPLGRSFSPGSGVPTTAAEAIEQRGLMIYNTNNAERAIIYRATENIPATMRTSLGGTTPELLIERANWGSLQPVIQYPLVPR